MALTAQKTFVLIGFVILAFLATTDIGRSAGLIDSDNPGFARIAKGSASIPIGHAQFCDTHKGECTVNRHIQAAVTLNEARWQQLVAINTEFNDEIIQVTDEELYHVKEFWTYPNGFGDCEDIALAKRRALIGLGWNPSVLLMTVAKEADGEGHAVLMVRTDRGDLILDNMDSTVRLWNQTPYHYVKRQSQANAGQWVNIIDNHDIAIASR